MMVIRKCSRYTYIHTIPCVQKQRYKKEIKKMAEWKLAFLVIICLLSLLFGGKGSIKTKCISIFIVLSKQLYGNTRESKRSGENSDFFTLTCTQFPQFLMVARHIAKRLVIYPKRFKTSYVYFDKSVKAIFPALNHFLHLF